MSATLKLRHLAEEIADMCDAGDYDELCAYAMASAIDARRMSMQCDRLSAEGQAAEKRAEKAEAARDAALAELKAARDAAHAEAKAAQEDAAEARTDAARLRALVDAARDERDRAVQEREAFSLRLSAALARPTYEARTTMPTPEERAAHLRAGGRWLRATPHHVSITHLHHTESVEHLEGATWLPLGADGLPCAWPVPAAEVTP